jgi:hypothetical protein
MSPAGEADAHRAAATVGPAPATASAPAPAAVSITNTVVGRMVAGGAAGHGGPGPLAAAGNRALQRWFTGSGPVQAKLAVSRPGDRLEREADAVAARAASEPAIAGDAFMDQLAAPVSRVARGVAGGAAGAAPPAPPDGGDPGGGAAPASVEAAVRNPGVGTPLGPDLRTRVEGHVGVDLGDVRVHGGPSAQLAAAEVNARAFTVGADIFLGAGESAQDVALMAHEATHVAQQQAVNVLPRTVQRSVDEYVPDFIVDGIKEYADDIPGYSALTVAVGYDPVAGRDVPRTPQNLVTALLKLVPFGEEIAKKLAEVGVLQDAFNLIDSGLTQHNLTLPRLQQEIDQAWSELSVTNGIDGNVAIIARHVNALVQDALAFARSVVDAVIQMIRDAAVGLAEEYLVDSPVWELAKKVLHYDPLRGVAVEATTVEIITDFLHLIGEDDVLAQMRERGTLQKTADWLDQQIARFMSLVSELGALFQAGWEAIQPENIANLATNLSNLARNAVGLVQRVAAFAGDLMAAVLRLVKDSLLGWLSTHADRIPGFRLLTVIIGVNPFTGEAVPRTAENLVGGFIALLPGGEATYAKLAESGVIAEAAGQVQSAMGRLGISLEMVTSTFLGVWDTLSLDDLLAPVPAFERVVARFGEPIGRIVEFVAEVVKIVIILILRLMNFPSDLLGSIISNAVSAIEDIQRDPIAFLMNMLAALKSGLGAFFENILTHLLKGLGDWLFRGLGQLGIQIPGDLSGESILNLVMQVLGVTAETLWQKLGQQIGPENVARIRGAVDTLTGAWGFIKDVQERGLAAIWDYIKDQIGNLWDTLLTMAQNWIVEQVVNKVVAKLISMLDPTGVMAVVNSFIAFFNAIESAIEYIRDILGIVNRYTATLAAIAKGDIAPGAAKLEEGLGSAVPVAIGFLANQVGLANVPEKVVEIIQGLREMIDKALDWLFQQAMRVGQAALAAITGTGQPGQAPPEGQVPPEGQIPPEGPWTPETVKAAARTELTGLQEVSDPAEVWRRLEEIMARHRPHGLKRLHVVPVAHQAGLFEVHAVASPGELVGGFQANRNMNISDIQFRAPRTVLTAHLNGTLLGTSRNYTDRDDSDLSGHAEMQFIAEFTLMLARLRANNTLDPYGDNRLVLRITRSPCEHCTQRLIRLKEQLDEIAPNGQNTIVIEAASLYRATMPAGAQSVWNLRELRARGIELAAWDIMAHAEEVFGPNVDRDALQDQIVQQKVEARVNEVDRWLRGFEPVDVT